MPTRWPAGRKSGCGYRLRVNPADAGPPSRSYRPMWNFPASRDSHSDGRRHVDQVVDGPGPSAASGRSGGCGFYNGQRKRPRRSATARGIICACRASGDTVPDHVSIRGWRHFSASPADRVVRCSGWRIDGQTVLVTGGRRRRVAITRYHCKMGGGGGGSRRSGSSAGLQKEGEPRGADCRSIQRRGTSSPGRWVHRAQRGSTGHRNVDFGGNIATTLN